MTACGNAQHMCTEVVCGLALTGLVVILILVWPH